MYIGSGSLTVATASRLLKSSRHVNEESPSNDGGVTEDIRRQSRVFSEDVEFISEAADPFTMLSTRTYPGVLCDNLVISI